MGLKLASLQLLLPAIEATRLKPGARVLLLGTQDLYFTYDQACAFLAAQGVAAVPVPQAERRCTNSFAYAAHEDWWKFKDYLHQKTLFRLFGFGDAQVDTIDVSTYEHAEIIHDLNDPVPPELGPYDLVVDFGTLEHIFDVRQAMWNLCELVGVGGRVVHFMPANMLDHGFYNWNSTVLADFYGQAGWTQEKLFYVASPMVETGHRVLYVKLPPGRIETPPGGFWLGLLGQFLKPAEPVSKPIAKQGLYVGLHDAWTRQSRDQSTHEAPAPKYGDGLRRWWADRRAALAFWRAHRAARRLGADLVRFDEPRAGSGA